MQYFVSLPKKLRLVSESVSLQFDNNFYQTEDEKILSFLEKHPLLGKDFFKKGDAPKRRDEDKEFDAKKVYRMGELKGILFNSEGKVKPNLNNKEDLLAEYETLTKEIGEI